MSQNQENQLNHEHRRTLLKIARLAVEGEVTGAAADVQRPADAALNRPCGVFVTLHVKGQLRGCIGTFQSNKPLYRTIDDMARAAVHDSRFVNQRLLESEFKDLDIDISVLSPLQKTDDPLSLQLGVHGIYIKKGVASGCFLPQVAGEMNWNKQQFLSYCCEHKAGLPADAWRDPDTEVLLFTAEVFSESAIG